MAKCEVQATAAAVKQSTENYFPDEHKILKSLTIAMHRGDEACEELLPSRLALLCLCTHSATEEILSVGNLFLRRLPLQFRVSQDAKASTLDV